jgi:uncharacterized peroxidase-related enzyme
MSWIKEIGEQDADDELKVIYDSIIKSRGKVSNIMKVHSLAPSSMKAHMDLYLEMVFKRPGLSRAEREMVGTYLSRLNGCSYCMDHHGIALLKYWKDEEKVEKLKAGKLEELGLSNREIALLDYATALTAAPGEMNQGDVQTLKEAGLRDEEILNTCMVISYFNFVNRIALGLGVEHSQEEMVGYNI